MILSNVKENEERYLVIESERFWLQLKEEVIFNTFIRLITIFSSKSVHRIIETHSMDI
jgi:hypothetical protein